MVATMACIMRRVFRSPSAVVFAIGMSAPIQGF
jgi:hypothetical protein